MNCTMRRPILCVSTLLMLGNVTACGSEEGGAPEEVGSTGTLESSPSSGDDESSGEETAGTVAGSSSTGSAAVCGDGILDDDEECEPGDDQAGIPCAADCRLPVREGWTALESGRIYNAVAIDDAGNVFAAGYEPNENDDDLIVQAYGPDGSQTWLYTRDSGSFDDDVATDVAMLPSGEVAVVGVVHAHEFAFSEEITVMRLDPVTGDRNWGLGLPKLSNSTVPQGARVAVNEAGAMVVTYSESGQGSEEALNYVFFDSRGGWAGHELREDDRSFVTDVVSGPDGQFAMLHWQEPVTPSDFVPGVDLYTADGTFVSNTPLIAEGDYPLRDAFSLAYAPDGTMRIPARVEVVSLDADLANAWALRFDESNSSLAIVGTVGPDGSMMFAGPRTEAGSFVASATSDGQPGWYLPLGGDGAVSLDRVGEQSVVVGRVAAEDGLSSWVQRVDVRFGDD